MKKLSYSDLNIIDKTLKLQQALITECVSRWDIMYGEDDEYNLYAQAYLNNQRFLDILTDKFVEDDGICDDNRLHQFWDSVKKVTEKKPPEGGQI